MDDRRSQAEALFQQAADLAPAERAAVLDRVCAGDPDLRRDVESLLTSHDAPPDDFLCTRGGDDAATADDLFAAGEVIADKYKLLHPLGTGGLGVVWLAEQRAPIRRKVALKFIRLGMNSRDVLARFEAERNALALMNHPNIARVLDAGIASTGQPFFAMEYVQGLPITKFCDQERLTTAQRLRLFTEVCDAVQHAHQKGVIHRDLKPANIMVALHEGQPVPKVIDFGIAKAMGQDLADRTLVTMPGQLLGTPEYMSPEQAQMSEIGVDSTTDIYSLGVILYELLTGTLPFDSETLRRHGLAEMHRVMLEVDPPKPSTRISTLGDSTSTLCARLRTDPRTLRSQLRGDLDWIVMKALEKERTRRYASASELAADVERHLQHEPVLAGPPRATYRLAKFVRRNRGVVIAAAVVLLALLAGIIGTTIMAMRAEAARADEVAQREAAEREATKAGAVRDFLFYALGFYNPNALDGRELTVAEMLRLSTDDLGKLFADQPLAEASVRGMLGRAHFFRTDYPAATEQLDLAMARYRDAPGQTDEEVLDLLRWRSYSKQEHGGDEVAGISRTVDLAVRMLTPRFPELAREVGSLHDYLMDARLNATQVEADRRFAELRACYDRSGAGYRGAYRVAYMMLLQCLDNINGLDTYALRMGALRFFQSQVPSPTWGSPGELDIDRMLGTWVVARMHRENNLELAHDLLRMVARCFPASHWFRGDSELIYGKALTTHGRGRFVEAEQYIVRGTNLLLRATPSRWTDVGAVTRFYQSWDAPEKPPRGRDEALDASALAWLEQEQVAHPEPRPADWAALAVAFGRSEHRAEARQALARARAQFGGGTDATIERLIREAELLVRDQGR